MFDPSEINLSDLPWLPLEEKGAFPRQPAIYFAIDSSGTVQYIGRSINPKQRWQSHHRFGDLNQIGSIKIAYLFVNLPSLLPAIESALILWFRPPLNVAGNSLPSEHLTEERYLDLIPPSDEESMQLSSPILFGNDLQPRLMELEEFRSLYPTLSREQIARVAGCSVALVDRWMMKGKTRKKPSEDHKTRLDIAHWFWSRESQEPSFFEELRRIKRGEPPL